MTGAGRPGRQTVGLGLMKGDVADAIIAHLSDHCPNLRIQDRTTFYLVEGEDIIQVDLPAVGEYLGRSLSMQEFLVAMTTYYGRAQVDEESFLVSAAMLQLDEAPPPFGTG